MASEGEPTRRRSTSVRRATKAAKAAAVDGMTVARQQQAALNERIRAEGGNRPVATGRTALRYEKVPAPKPAPRPEPAKIVVVTSEPVRNTGLRAPATSQTAEARKIWTVGDAVRQLRDGYSLERVVLRTGYSEMEIKVAGGGKFISAP